MNTVDKVLVSTKMKTMLLLIGVEKRPMKRPMKGRGVIHLCSHEVQPQTNQHPSSGQE